MNDSSAVAGEDGSRKPRAIDRLRVAIHNTIGLTHAGLVMAKCAELENDIEGAIKRRLVPMSKNMSDRIFQGYGPLSTFSAKIDMSFGLGIVDESTLTELQKIKKIRNLLAHAPAQMTLNDEPVLSCFKTLDVAPSAQDNPSRIFRRAVDVIRRKLTEAPPPAL